MKKPKVFTQTTMKLSDVQGSMCVWEGCDATFKGELPAGWVWLVTYWAPWPEGDRTMAEVCCGPFCKHDAVLCSTHAAKLDTLLKDIGGKLRDVAGSA